MCSSSGSLLSEDRLRQGYVIVLPGIEGYSWLNRSIVRGLKQAGVPYAMEIHDWTCRWPFMLYNLRSRRLHDMQAALVREMILTYQQRWPQRPVFLIGHSGGGAMVVKILESLPEKRTIAGAVLLGAAISPDYDFRAAIHHVDRKVWNFTSLGDLLFLGIFTAVVGTLDGKNSVSAGMTGFVPRQLTTEEAERFREMPYHCSYLRDRNLAGHFGFTAPRFVRNRIAPLLMSADVRCEEPGLEAAKISDCLLNASPS